VGGGLGGGCFIGALRWALRRDERNIVVVSVVVVSSVVSGLESSVRTGLRLEPDEPLLELGDGQDRNEAAHEPHQAVGLRNGERAARRPLDDRARRDQGITRGLELGQVEIEQTMPQRRGDAIHADALGRGIAVLGAVDHGLRHLGGVLVQGLLGDDGALVARSARAPGGVAALAWFEGHDGLRVG